MLEKNRGGEAAVAYEYHHEYEDKRLQVIFPPGRAAAHGQYVSYALAREYRVVVFCRRDGDDSEEDNTIVQVNPGNRGDRQQPAAYAGVDKRALSVLLPDYRQAAV